MSRRSTCLYAVVGVYVLFTLPAVKTGIAVIPWRAYFAVKHEEDKKPELEPARSTYQSVMRPIAVIPDVPTENRRVMNFPEQLALWDQMVLGRNMVNPTIQSIVSTERTGEVSLVISEHPEEGDGETLIIRLIGLSWAEEPAKPTTLVVAAQMGSAQ